TTTLTGNNTYSGGTTVAAGRLNVDGAIAGDVQVDTGATLGGDGTVGGIANLASGAHLAPGASPGTLTVGGLLLNGGSFLDYDLGTPNVIGGATNDLVDVTGNLTLAGTLNVTNSGNFGSGVYRLMNYGGALTNNGLAIGAQPAGFAPADFLLQTSQANQVNLIAQAGGFANQFWDGAQTVGNGVIDGGTGTWNTATTHWTGANGAVNAPWQTNSFAIFQGTPGIVTVDNSAGAVQLGGAQFVVTGYTVTGQPLTVATPGTVIRVGDGSAAGAATTATIASVIQGNGGLDKTDLGTLVLTGNDTYSGGTTISGGTLQLGNGGTSGSVIGGILDNATLAFNRSDAVTFANGVSGTGSLTQAGSGTTILTGTNTYTFTGGTYVNAGTLQLTGTGAIGSGAVNIASTGQFLLTPASGNYRFNNALTGSGALIATLGSAADTLNFGAAVGSAFTGNVTLNQSNFALGGTNTTALTNATLQLNSGNTTTVDAGAQAIGDLTLNGNTLIFANLPSGTLSTGALTLNSGTVRIDPGSMISLAGSLLTQDDGVNRQLISATSVNGSAANLALTDLAGNPLTTVAVNIAQDGNTVAIGTYSFTLNTQANTGLYAGYGLSQLDLQAGQTLTLSGDTPTPAGAADMTARITGSGALDINATNSITLTNAANVYTGATTVSGGTLVLGSNGALGDTALLALNAGTTADINGKTQAIGTLGGTGTLNIDAGNLTINSGGAFSGVISGTRGALNANGGALILTGDSTYTGGTTINAGTLQIGNGGTVGSYAGNIADNAALAFNRSDTATYGGVVSGPGSLTQQGSGTTVLTGGNTYTGGTTISAGTLQLGNGGNTGSVAGNIIDNAALAFNRSGTATYGGVVSGFGSLTQQGSGTTVLTGGNT
ncbi:autotransporter-associated beta strand repeat-containing protein, partial [Caballeronia sp.]|uniref:autotransporter outer membrane beta-barrel domain-containing protein n=1 Tax=Caballeronia sp. TaxID=1931223 RepID=UPI003C6ACDDD